jgi:hypothetical protein
MTRVVALSAGRFAAANRYQTVICGAAPGPDLAEADQAASRPSRT